MDFVPHTPTDYETATSYLSVADADEIIAGQADGSAWAALSAASKQIILNQASLAIDGAMAYQGDKTSALQLLKFPRDAALLLPNTIKFATAIMAMRVSNDDAFKNVSSESIGKLSWAYRDSGYDVTGDVLAFLKPLRQRSIRLNQ